MPTIAQFWEYRVLTRISCGQPLPRRLANAIESLEPACGKGIVRTSFPVVPSSTVISLSLMLAKTSDLPSPSMS